MQDLTVHVVQSPLYWEDIEKNLEMFAGKIREVQEDVDLIVLPEMFTTGFTQVPHDVAETMDGPAMQWMHRQADAKDCVVTGSIVIRDGKNYFNRLVWMRPDGSYTHYDKKHLFTFAGENKHYSPGKEKLIVECNGWKIKPVICYDLRFPVWNRNTWDAQHGFAYDCLLNVANWPGPRSHVWRILLMARALENQAFVIGVNRIGEDANNIVYSGDSAVISPKGENLSGFLPNEEKGETIVLSREELDRFRDKFRVWADWDRFDIRSCPAPDADCR